MWKQNSTLLDNPWTNEETKREIRRSSGLNEHEKITYQNWGNAAKKQCKEGNLWGRIPMPGPFWSERGLNPGQQADGRTSQRESGVWSRPHTSRRTGSHRPQEAWPWLKGRGEGRGAGGAQWDLLQNASPGMGNVGKKCLYNLPEVKWGAERMSGGEIACRWIDDRIMSDGKWTRWGWRSRTRAPGCAVVRQSNKEGPTRGPGPGTKHLVWSRNVELETLRASGGKAQQQMESGSKGDKRPRDRSLRWGKGQSTQRQHAKWGRIERTATGGNLHQEDGVHPGPPYPQDPRDTAKALA